ncbi:hypothetical protein K493DRAFT_305947 [Basidiobolus meristosporus CBS 931.73]|uniref:BPTI/Kunitz inhibitor domain-containing protein n=1 Tax=Basidiobolus meristosporus CBS 931.73 TaxID=1314790 RepID=A0A1Y1XUR2_9FUNG|nr:hypothetical protein K493DRAFT_305947 [Basidiobolus meristosporus CBS 931.73]|eukprot:ORX89226.1 hypothetical protein K493DRAFT_305947 [Basidiobolus meristosporus CBS 931.73]
MFKIATLATVALAVLSSPLDARMLPEVCQRKGAPGICKASIPSWQFNPATKKCEKFIHGGCGGFVPFTSLEKCQATCNPEPKPKPGPDKLKSCYSPADPGPCRARIRSWHYNKFTQKCEMFLYGGCKGNVPFKSVEDCRQTCEGEEPKHKLETKPKSKSKAVPKLKSKPKSESKPKLLAKG